MEKAIWDGIGCFLFTSQVCMCNNLFRSPLLLWLPDAFELPWGLVQRDGKWFRNVNLKTKLTNLCKVQLLTPILIQWRHSVKGAKQVALKMARCNIHPAATIRWAVMSSLNNTTVSWSHVELSFLQLLPLQTEVTILPQNCRELRRYVSSGWKTVLLTDYAV